MQVEGDGNGTGQMGDDTNEGEEPPPVDAAQADTDAPGDEDDGTIILVNEDKAETRYTLRGEANIGGADYRALNPVEGGDTAYFLYAKGEGDEPDTYAGLDDLGDVKVSDAVEPGAGEAAQQG